jgi:hypothetical protein
MTCKEIGAPISKVKVFSLNETFEGSDEPVTSLSLMTM